MRSARSQPGFKGISRDLINSRLEVLRFDPAFHGALACSAMGDLASLWMGLRGDERRELEQFARDHHRFRRWEMLGETGKVESLKREIAETHPLFRPLIEDTATEIGRGVSETTQND